MLQSVDVGERSLDAYSGVAPEYFQIEDAGDREPVAVSFGK